MALAALKTTNRAARLSERMVRHAEAGAAFGRLVGGDQVALDPNAPIRRMMWVPLADPLRSTAPADFRPQHGKENDDG